MKSETLVTLYIPSAFFDHSDLKWHSYLQRVRFTKGAKHISEVFTERDAKWGYKPGTWKEESRRMLPYYARRDVWATIASLWRFSTDCAVHHRQAGHL